MKALLLLLILGLAGCAQPAVTTPSPLSSVLVVEARNNGTSPAWFRLVLTDQGTTIVSEERGVGIGASTTWQSVMQPRHEYKFTVDYSTTPTIQNGFGTGGSVNATLCPGGTFLARIWGALAENGQPAVSMKFRDGCT